MPIASPCNKTCVIDRKRGLCIGCGRTGEEIARGLGFTEGERSALMALLPGRLEAAAAGT